uniref:FLYWCH-type domain-containing protein n=1 Tax=Trichuris muris TaxID=70415 RepID=A0A5S6Q419_TRIMR
MTSSTMRLNFAQLRARFVNDEMAVVQFTQGRGLIHNRRICPATKGTWCCDPGKTVLTCGGVAMERSAGKSCQRKQGHGSKGVNVP